MNNLFFPILFVAVCVGFYFVAHQHDEIFSKGYEKCYATYGPAEDVDVQALIDKIRNQ